MFVTGPNVVKAVTHEDVDAETLGGATTHTTRSGVAHLAAPRRGRGARRRRGGSSATCPQNNLGDAPRGSTSRSGRPTRRRTRRDRPRRSVASPTTCTTSSSASSTTATFLEIQPGWAPNIIVGFARLGGRSVGIVAQQPAVLAGALDIDASTKAARFVRTCDCFNVPLRHLRRRAGLPAGRRPGARRDHPPRREAAVRLLRGDGPEADGHHAQGVWRRVRRHEQQAHPRRHQPRVADRRDRGHGRRGRGQHHLSRRDRGGRRPGRRARATGRGLREPSSPTRTSRRRAATSTTSSGRPRRGRG